MGHVRNPLGLEVLSSFASHLLVRVESIGRRATHLELTRLNVSLQEWIDVEHDELVHADDAAHDHDAQHFGFIRHVPDLEFAE